MFGIESPIFAFSHCRDVVVDVSKAGGLGVLGMRRAHPERLEEDLRWIDEHIGGRPYGVDIRRSKQSRLKRVLNVRLKLSLGLCREVAAA